MKADGPPSVSILLYPLELSAKAAPACRASSVETRSEIKRRGSLFYGACNLRSVLGCIDLRSRFGVAEVAIKLLELRASNMFLGWDESSHSG